MIFRLSHKLSSKIKAGLLPALPLDDNPLADWSAALFVAGRTPYILLSNTRSLYSTVMPAKGITDEGEFTVRALGSIRDFLQHNGREAVYERLIAPTTGTVRFAAALSRSVTGSMNELARHATDWLADGDVPMSEVGPRLNDILLSALARSESAPYGKPREAFQALLDRL